MRCVTVSVTALRRATSISTGALSMVSASFLISSEKVAEKSRLCRSFGSMARMRLMSGMKPMSSMRSASSSTSTSTLLKVTLFCCTWSSRRPGVATTISTPFRSASVCGLMSTPP
ncbi:MAG: hypothetical protein MOGDAGHF_01056 [Rhodocyclaceae bacterium]|nr:hypothetical protein [Rhodocyclaceae bacterium]